MFHAQEIKLRLTSLFHHDTTAQQSTRTFVQKTLAKLLFNYANPAYLLRMYGIKHIAQCSAAVLTLILIFLFQMMGHHSQPN